MPKLTIDETTYYTDNFNEEQSKAWQELQQAQMEANRYEYLQKMLVSKVQSLAGDIARLATPEPVPEPDTYEEDIKEEKKNAKKQKN